MMWMVVVVHCSESEKSHDAIIPQERVDPYGN